MDFLNLFAHTKNVEVYAAGDVVFRVGDPGAKMYVVLEGRVRSGGISRDGAAVWLLLLYSTLSPCSRLPVQPQPTIDKAAPHQRNVRIKREAFMGFFIRRRCQPDAWHPPARHGIAASEVSSAGAVRPPPTPSAPPPT